MHCFGAWRDACRLLCIVLRLSRRTAGVPAFCQGRDARCVEKKKTRQGIVYDGRVTDDPFRLDRWL